jgi:formate dehydrogenase iron-sulfur subunit
MKALLIDVTRCTGCGRCAQACRESHGLAEGLPFARLSGDGLSSRSLCVVEPLPGGRFVKKQCLHCLHPGCVDACPVGAMKKTPEGPVVYDPARCMGCRYCMLACPVKAPRYEWEKALPYIQKCDLCHERLARGLPTACAEACPTGACAFGERDALLAEGRRRAAALPGGRLYGERELGGTGVLYLSDVPLDAIGWPQRMGERSLAEFTWPLISKTPFLAAGVGAFLAGTWWVIGRRMRLEAERAAAHGPGGAPPPSDAAGGGTVEGGAP